MSQTYIYVVLKSENYHGSHNIAFFQDLKNAIDFVGEYQNSNLYYSGETVSFKIRKDSEGNDIEWIWSSDDTHLKIQKKSVQTGELSIEQYKSFR